MSAFNIWTSRWTTSCWSTRTSSLSRSNSLTLASELSGSGLKGAAFVLQVFQQEYNSSKPKDGRRIDFKGFLYEMLSGFLDTEGTAASLSSVALTEFKSCKHECAP